MNAKLTLSINEQLIAKAKEAAARRGMSLSALVEGYLKSLVIKTEGKPNKEDEDISQTITALRGSIKLPKDFDGDYKSIIEEYRTEKWEKK
jgi:hypothetical protein